MELIFFSKGVKEEAELAAKRSCSRTMVIRTGSPNETTCPNSKSRSTRPSPPLRLPSDDTLPIPSPPLNSRLDSSLRSTTNPHSSLTTTRFEFAFHSLSSPRVAPAFSPCVSAYISSWLWRSPLLLSYFLNPHAPSPMSVQHQNVSGSLLRRHLPEHEHTRKGWVVQRDDRAGRCGPDGRVRP